MGDKKEAAMGDSGSCVHSNSSYNLEMFDS